MGEGRWPELTRAATPGERIAAAGALASATSLLLPWYGVPVAGGLVKTGAGTFDLATAALLLTVAAALALIASCAAGRELPRPLDEGALLVAAGVWSSLLVAYRMADRPEFPVAGGDWVGLRYGIFLALAGAIALVVGGLGHRRRPHR